MFMLARILNLTIWVLWSNSMFIIKVDNSESFGTHNCAFKCIMHIMLMRGAVENAANLSNFYTFSIIELNGINT